MIKDEAIEAISSLPKSANIDDIMYRLYVIDKIRKGQTAVRNGEVLSIESLQEEIEKW